MAQEHDTLANRVAMLERKVADLATYLQSALNYTASDPSSSLIKLRTILEKLLPKLYRYVMCCDPCRLTIGDMLADKKFIAHIPKRILACMNEVWDLSNLGPYDEDINMTNATRVMRNFIDVLEWYAIDFDPKMGSFNVQQSENAVEILPKLKEKYPGYLRADITSVKFVQSNDRCYLEMTTAESVAGYLHNETIKREDLAFITSGSDDDGVLFDPKDPIVENVRKFVLEMDVISIINCIDLFPPEIATKINRMTHFWRDSR